jgi:hypothetical protein
MKQIKKEQKERKFVCALCYDITPVRDMADDPLAGNGREVCKECWTAEVMFFHDPLLYTSSMTKKGDEA